MAATKTKRVLLTSQSLAAGASVNVTEWNLSTAYAGSRLVVRLTNGATAPTTVPIVNFYVGGATTEKYLLTPVSGDKVNASVNDVFFVYEQGDMFANATITNGATNAITVEAFGLEATTI